MNPTHWSTHVKHVVVVLLIAGGAMGCFWLRGLYETRQAGIMAERDKQIAANQQTVKQSQGVIDGSQKVVTQADVDLAAQLAALKAQLAQKLSPAEAIALVNSLLPGANASSTKDAQGNPVISIPDTQENRDRLNQASGAYKTCQFNLEDCAKARQQYETVIVPEKDKQLKADTDTIKLQGDQIKDLMKYQVPRWTAMIGVAKMQGTSFQAAGSYQPFIGVDYRLFKDLGVGAGVQNKSVMTWLSWRFGRVAK